MKKYFSLIKASMSEGMNIFKISTKNKSKFTKVILPIILTIILMGAMCSYSITIITQLREINMEFVLLTLFIIITSFLTLIEGIYKSSNLLFNCKDDNLLLSLPISKSVIVFMRILKFYLFELAYNSLFIIPTIVVYAIYMYPSITISYYIVSLIGLFLFPIMPIFFSCLIGTATTFISSKSRKKNMIQTLLTVAILLGALYISINAERIILDISNNASNINDFITKLYYPAGAYIELIMNFNTLKLFEFIGINLLVFGMAVLLISKFYFRINSNVKTIKTRKTNKKYVIRTSTPVWALMKKEFNRFINSTVYLTNAGFGLILFILGCIAIVVKFESIADKIIEINPNMTLDYLKNCISLILFAFVSVSSFMTSITSSMISLEGKSFVILKSLPIKPYTIVQSKILAAILIMVPCILVGDIIVFLKFNFDMLSIILILIASLLFPLLSETIGIIVNLKYPRMDAKNDTEIVKQSMSSSISVFLGMGLTGITLFTLYKLLESNISLNGIMIGFIAVYTIFYMILTLLLRKICDKCFNNISI